MPSIETPAPSAPALTLEAFVAMAEADQLERINACADSGRLGELLHLHDAYVRWAELHQHDPTARGWLSLRVLARLLDVLQPGDIYNDGYREQAQDGRLRQRLTPAALARIREESFEGTIAPLLAADEETRARFIASLDPHELRSLDTLLRRYASDRSLWRDGRPRATAAVRAMVAQRLAAISTRQKGKP